MLEHRLDDAFLQRLIDEYDTPDVTAFGLSGSFARGEAHRYSDVDLIRYLRGEPADGYFVRYVEGKLVSVTTVTIEQKRGEMHKPGSAIWVVSALRRMRILLDKDGALAKLQLEAELFEWDREQAEAHASDYLAGCAEEAHKLMHGLERGDEGATAYATMGMVLSLAHTMAVANMLLITSENSYFREVGTAVGTNSAWTQQMRQALGWGETSTIQARALAALRLFRETARVIEPILRPEDKTVIDTCRTILDQHTTRD